MKLNKTERKLIERAVSRFPYNCEAIGAREFKAAKSLVTKDVLTHIDSYLATSWVKGRLGNRQVQVAVALLKLNS